MSVKERTYIPPRVREVEYSWINTLLPSLPYKDRNGKSERCLTMSHGLPSINENHVPALIIKIAKASSTVDHVNDERGLKFDFMLLRSCSILLPVPFFNTTP